MRKLLTSVVFALWGATVIGMGETAFVHFDALVHATVVGAASKTFVCRTTSTNKSYNAFDWKNDKVTLDDEERTLSRRSIMRYDNTRNESEIVQISAIDANDHRNIPLKDDTLMPGTTKGPDTQEFKESLHGRMFAWIWEQQRRNQSYVLPIRAFTAIESGDFSAISVESCSRNLDEFYIQFQDIKGTKRYTDLKYWGLYQVSGTKFPQYNMKYTQRAAGKFAHQHFLQGESSSEQNPLLATVMIKLPDSGSVTGRGYVVGCGVVIAALAGLLKVCAWW